MSLAENADIADSSLYADDRLCLLIYYIRLVLFGRILKINFQNVSL